MDAQLAQRMDHTIHRHEQANPEPPQPPCPEP